MRREFARILVALSAASTVIAQQPAPPATPPAVRLGDPGVAAPELIPERFVTEQVTHCQKWGGTILLSVIIDPSGLPRDIYLLRPTGDDLDKFALEIAARDHFKPGSLNGAPAAVESALEVKLEYCIEPVTTGSNAGMYNSKLRSQPEQTILPLSKVHDSSVSVTGLKSSKGVMPPVPLNDPRPGPGTGRCTLSVLVDEHGMPQDPKLVDGPNDYCQEVMAVVGRQRYKPAMKDGEPIAVRIGFVFDGRILRPLNLGIGSPL
jgi:Gram-negative bacterial TonB protein C-terminal